jgi:hypothetical protein
MPSNETTSSLGYVSRISRPRHILLHLTREEQQKESIKRRAAKGKQQEKRKAKDEGMAKDERP